MTLVKTFFLLLLVSIACSSFATTHTIQFGGSLGLNYSPKTMNVNVGDTIIFSGDFGSHPLASTAVPAGASSFTKTSGSGTFLYVVEAPGNYAYQCNFHFSSGMKGTFAAVAAGVAVPAFTAHELEQNFPNPASHETMIHVMLDQPDDVSLKLFDSKGDEVATILNGRVDAGMHMITLDVMPFASGTYTYILTTSKGVTEKSLVVLR